MAATAAMYFASHVDLATVGCMQDAVAVPLTRKTEPVTERLQSASLAKSESQ